MIDLISLVLVLPLLAFCQSQGGSFNHQLALPLHYGWGTGFGSTSTSGTNATRSLTSARYARSQVSSPPIFISRAVACDGLKEILPNAVSFPGDDEYDDDIWHRYESSTEQAKCSVHPADEQDVIEIVKFLQQKHQLSFAIKSGGCATDIGVSSTTGLMISLKRLNSVVYKSHTNTVEIGMGTTWDHVYNELDKLPVKVNVAGGRITGVGVGGFILGGGYSWLSNKHGLAINSVVSYQVVLPNGNLVVASQTERSDLFFALQGGFNNFGIVTKVTMKAFPQGKVCAGVFKYDVSEIAAVKEAIAGFQANNNYTDGNIFAVYSVAKGPESQKTTTAAVIMWYNDVWSNMPQGFRDQYNIFKKIPTRTGDISDRTFANFITDSSSIFQVDPTRRRAQFDTASLAKLDIDDLDNIVNLIDSYGYQGNDNWDPDARVAATIEPFILNPANFTHQSAWDHSPLVSPLVINFSWKNSNKDSAGGRAIRAAGARIRKQLEISYGRPIPLLLYSNYALADESLAKVFGRKLPLLRHIRQWYDRAGLMLRTGGWKFTETPNEDA